MKKEDNLLTAGALLVGGYVVASSLMQEGMKKLLPNSLLPKDSRSAVYLQNPIVGVTFDSLNYLREQNPLYLQNPVTAGVFGFLDDLTGRNKNKVSKEQYKLLKQLETFTVEYQKTTDDAYKQKLEQAINYQLQLINDSGFSV